MLSFDEIIILEDYLNKNSEALYLVKKSQSLRSLVNEMIERIERIEGLTKFMNNFVLDATFQKECFNHKISRKEEWFNNAP